ncbi:hypothetical protein QM012_002972 [Aureobasidium pullulans]|uniref:Uncharacterized protein n=1 Tax=Aureobasidium pullulans TaxID=5580 RepID=A0ABR0T8Y3_AURPU
MSQTDQEKAVQSIGNVSILLRKAIGAALPAAPEQYLTISIPGTVIDLTAIENGGTCVYDTSRYVTAPTQVRQAEGKLIDGMMPLSNIMIGNTGTSVPRSYTQALDALIARKTIIGSDSQTRRPGQSDYDAAMTYLTTRDPQTGLTPVEVYTDKQQKWAGAQDA